MSKEKNRVEENILEIFQKEKFDIEELKLILKNYLRNIGDKFDDLDKTTKEQIFGLALKF